MVDDRSEAFLATAFAAPRDRRQALLAMAVLVVAFAITLPLARWQAPAIPQFVPIYDTAIFVLDTLTAVLLYAQFEHLERRSLLVLACAFVFTPLVVAAHALSIPNAFVPGIVLGSEQSAAWLWVVWHSGFPLFIGGYALLARTAPTRVAAVEAPVRRVGTIALLGTIALALAAIACVTLGDAAMPTLMRGDAQYSRLTKVVLTATWLVHVGALCTLVWYTRLRRMIDAWLAVTLVALAIDVLLSGALIDTRYELGYYLGRVYGLLGALFVLVVLLRQTVTLSAMAARFLDFERDARRNAESAGLAKDQFLAMLGHELRNPLSPIVTALQLMRLRGVDAQELPIVERQVRHLTQLVDDLLDVSRVTKGKVTLRKVHLELSDVVQRAVEIASPALEQKSQRLELRLEPTSLAVEADPARVAQVVVNLLTNASKYSESGTRIFVRTERDGDRARLRVQDEGVGIAPDMLDRIFEPFTQQNQTLARSEGGLGLGLTIVRSLVDLHGGTVAARSGGPGRGSEFIVELPLAYARSDEGPRDLPLELRRDVRTKPARILVVDDNADAAATLSELLTALGHVVETAHDAPSAIELASSFRPEIGLLDIGLPVMDGYELARRLRATVGAAALHLVAVTGYGLESDRERSAAAGFSEHLVKPVDLEALQKVVERLS